MKRYHTKALKLKRAGYGYNKKVKARKKHRY